MRLKQSARIGRTLLLLSLERCIQLGESLKRSPLDYRATLQKLARRVVTMRSGVDGGTQRNAGRRLWRPACDACVRHVLLAICEHSTR